MEKHNKKSHNDVDKSFDRPAFGFNNKPNFKPHYNTNKSEKVHYNENVHYKNRFTLRDIKITTDVEKIFSWKRLLLSDKHSLETIKNQSKSVKGLLSLNSHFLSVINKRLVEITRLLTDMKHDQIGGDLKLKATILGQIKKVSKEQNLNKFIVKNILDILTNDTILDEDVIQCLYDKSEKLAIQQFDDYVNNKSIDLIEIFDPEIVKIVEYVNTEIKKLSLTETIESVQN